MNNFLKNHILPPKAFPKLLEKHSEEIKQNQESESLYYKQAHEIYMYEFFEFCGLDYTSKIEINKVKGIAMCPIKLSNFSANTKSSEEEFFKMLIKSPVPFVFIPQDKVLDSLKLCSGAVSFRESEKQGILMDLEFACELGIDFLATEFLMRKDVFQVYVGVVHCH